MNVKQCNRECDIPLDGSLFVVVSGVEVGPVDSVVATATTATTCNNGVKSRECGDTRCFTWEKAWRLETARAYPV